MKSRTPQLLQRAKLIVTLGSTSALFLFFQNCGPSNQNLHKGLPQGLPQGSENEVRVIEDWRSEKVTFFNSNLEIPQSLQEISLGGFCDRNNELQNLEWQLLDSENISGSVPCEQGSFRIDLAQIDQLDCGSEHQLLVRDEAGAEALMFLNRSCGEK